MHLTLPAIRPARPDWREGTPVSSDYSDAYYSAGCGPGESATVFIEATALHARFAGLGADGLFVIGETGFGTGLNCLLAARLFLANAARGGHLHLYSAERHPLSPVDLQRALAQWPQFGELSARLLEHYPPAAPGFHRLQLHPRVSLTLMFGDCLSMWQHCDAQVDAWFLDGFAPARNPDMWSDALLLELAARARPGCLLGTFTAAGQVRRGLEKAGFEVRREAGFGGKRHRLSARMPGPWQARSTITGHAIVAGAGLAGCTSARALAERGWQVTVIDPAVSADETPRSLAGVVYATASHHLHAQNRLYQSGLLHARRMFARAGFPADPSQGRFEGMIQRLVDERMKKRTLAAIETGAWPTSMLTALNEDSVLIRHGGSVSPTAWCRHLLDHPAITVRAWQLVDFESGVPVGIHAEGGQRMECDVLILCTAGQTAKLPGLDWLPLRIVRGQVTFCRATAESAKWRRPHCHTGYLTPALNGVHCVGATFDRSRTAPVIDPADDRDNLLSLARHLPDRYTQLGGTGIEVVGQHASTRCQSPDTLPLAGPLPDPGASGKQLIHGVWLNIAHGSRGLTHTPICAELIADAVSGHPAPVDDSIAAALAPARLVERMRRRSADS